MFLGPKLAGLEDKFHVGYINRERQDVDVELNSI